MLFKPSSLNWLGGALLFLAGNAQAQTAPVPKPIQRPNIVLILADDMGYRDTGFTGSDFYETPNLDRLAKQGMVFNNAYAGAANCAPSRACLVSGQYTPRHGVIAVFSSDRGPKNLQRLVPIPNKSGLAPSVLSVAEGLKAGGYATGVFGKWHLGGPEGASPATQGFDTSFDPVKADENGDEEGGTIGSPEDPKNVFAITDAAGRFMEKNKDRPFFAYVAHHAVHVPLAARPETLAKFRAKTPGKMHSNVNYAGCVADFDTSVGQLMTKIRDLGIEKNTLVIFTSDNGGLNARGETQEPLRGNKGAYYEGGIREPMWAIWPGVIAPGTQTNVPVTNLDFFPTFLEAGKITPPTDKILDGESLVPLFRQEKALKRPAIFWHFPGYLNNPVQRGRDPIFRTRPVSVIRKGDWKLL
ncbi:aryl-sulfate sulfohydrolase, partial [bacterium]